MQVAQSLFQVFEVHIYWRVTMPILARCYFVKKCKNVVVAERCWSVRAVCSATWMMNDAVNCCSVTATDEPSWSPSIRSARPWCRISEGVCFRLVEDYTRKDLACWPSAMITSASGTSAKCMRYVSRFIDDEWTQCRVCVIYYTTNDSALRLLCYCICRRPSSSSLSSSSSKPESAGDLWIWMKIK